MPLITKPTQIKTKELLRTRIDKDIIEQITKYCDWQGIDKDYFIEQAALLVFKKDAEWKDFSKQAKESPNESKTH